VNISLEVSVANAVETLSSRVDDVDEDMVTVLVPMVRLRSRPLPTGTTVYATYAAANRRWRFVSEVLGVSRDGLLQHLAPPAVIESSDRRGAFRLETALRPELVYRLAPEPGLAAPEVARETLACTLIDLSEGGVCLASRDTAAPGDRLGIVVDLPNVGALTARLGVTSVEAPSAGHLNHVIHCLFEEISRGDRDKIARFLMRRQIEMRQRGQL
jgi:c-di-GMP-binding flagellar brake protein YcgR